MRLKLLTWGLGLKQSFSTALKNSDDFKRALEFKAQFHHYSFANCWLIYSQCPHATLIAGYRKWQELGRQVKKGEKSIAIFAPLIRKEKVEITNEKISWLMAQLTCVQPRG
jgi:hypothetical protein